MAVFACVRATHRPPFWHTPHTVRGLIGSSTEGPSVRLRNSWQTGPAAAPAKTSPISKKSSPESSANKKSPGESSKNLALEKIFRGIFGQGKIFREIFQEILPSKNLPGNLPVNLQKILPLKKSQRKSSGNLQKNLPPDESPWTSSKHIAGISQNRST